MCGIVGMVVRDNAIDPHLLAHATQSLAHRGPDDSGTAIIQGGHAGEYAVGLGSRRLAILDLSPSGHQPMRDPETGNWIVYNGEIYNYRELRAELEAAGAHFIGNSDTEVALKAFGKWRERCLGRLRGMFALAFWEAAGKRLILARDPMGIKPLYYYASDKYFLFSSEVRTLLQTNLVPRALDPAALLDYLSFGSICDPNTLIRGVCAVRAGHYLAWGNGSLREVEYWDPIRASEASESGEDLAHEAGRAKRIEDLHRTLEESVRMQLVSDVPIGLFLSGGIDSSSLVALLRHGGVTPSTFSIVFREKDCSEAEHSRAVARKFATDHHEILVSQHDALEAIPGATRAMDQPSIDGLNTYLISRHTRAAGIKVVLSGLGGDEVFAGYSTFRTVPRMERLAGLWRHMPGALRGPLNAALERLAPETDRNRKLAALACANGNATHPYLLARALFTPRQCQQLAGSWTEGVLADRNSALGDTLQRACRLDPINRISYLEARCYLLNTLLRDTDSMSMAHGLEVRVPLIDHLLVERALALPGKWKLNGDSPKPLLTGAVPGLLPDAIVHRPKRGFTLPFDHWLRDELRAEVENTIGRVAQGPLGSILDFPAVRKIWQDFMRGTTSWSRPWSLYVLQRWCEANLQS